MVVHRRRKFSRMRATRTHKWGHKKRHRKSGNRGGFGMAGTGKRAGHKKFTILKEYERYFGKYGFRSLYKIDKKVVNLDFLEENYDRLGKKEGDSYAIDLCKLGFDKVLGNGNLTKKLKITCKDFSKSAEEKIKKIGGEAIRC